MTDRTDRRSQYLPMLLVLALALAIRIHDLASWPFEQDELYTLRDALRLSGVSKDAPGIVARPVYYLLQHLLLLAAPPTPLVLRLPAFVFGLAGVWLTWEVGRRHFSPRGGLVAALLVALSPWHLYASQFARYWTLVYLLAALACLALPQALDHDRPARYVGALLIVLLGALTHPTFLFPLVGVAFALMIVSAEGRIAWRWPTRTGWAWLWGPLLVTALVGSVALRATGNASAYSNGWGRGLFATARTIPGMVEWVSPGLVIAGVGGVCLLWLRPGHPSDRRWAAMAALGTASGVSLLLWAGLRNGIYADYGMAMLPLLYLTVGGAIARTSENMGWGGAWAVVATAVLVAGALPGTLSNLSDGMRFDYRPAYQYLQQAGAGRLAIGWPVAEQRYYAPGIPFQGLDGMNVTVPFLERTLTGSSGFWFVGSQGREGVIGVDPAAAHWMDMHCETVLRTERPRFDFRVYEVELLWCGPASDPPDPIVFGARESWKGVVGVRRGP